MKVSFTTLGCPSWDLETIIRKGREYGFDGIDFRGIGTTIDITTLPQFTKHIHETRTKFSDAGLAVSGVSSSIKVCDPDKQADYIEEAKRTIDVCIGLGSKNIRVFGGGPVEKIGHEKAAETGAQFMKKLLELDGARELFWLFETHDHWIKSEHCRLLLDRISDPEFGVLWDIGHTPRVGGEKPEETYAALGSRVRVTHVKDAVYDTSHPQAMADGWRYVEPGTGQLPLAEAIRLLRKNGYDGWYTLEHEKRWHPELPEPEVIFPKYVSWIRSI